MASSGMAGDIALLRIRMAALTARARSVDSGGVGGSGARGVTVDATKKKGKGGSGDPGARVAAVAAEHAGMMTAVAALQVQLAAVTARLNV